MANHILRNSGDVASEIVVLVVLRALEATPGARPRLQGCSDEQIAAALAVLSEAGFVEDYVLTATGCAFLRKMADT